jgi:hypothetical protein
MARRTRKRQRPAGRTRPSVTLDSSLASRGRRYRRKCKKSHLSWTGFSLPNPGRRKTRFLQIARKEDNLRAVDRRS